MYKNLNQKGLFHSFFPFFGFFLLLTTFLLLSDNNLITIYQFNI
jgi:uncharacterized protein (DUF2062 family)